MAFYDILNLLLQRLSYFFALFFLPMAVTIDIVPFSDPLEMVGEPDPSSAYSLSGHVAISISSQNSFFNRRRRTVRLILQSLTIAFEGQTELISPQISYVPLRLCSVTRQVAPPEFIELSNDGHEDSDDRCTWNVVFDLPIPGWLPETTNFGLDAVTGTSYGLHATAKFLTVEDPSNTSWLSLLCSPFRSSTKVVRAHKSIVVNRYMNNPSSTPSSPAEFPLVNYTTQCKPVDTPGVQDAMRISPEVLSSVQVIASVPEYVDAKADSMPFAIRLRAKDMDESYRHKLQVTGFYVQLKQNESYRSVPASDYSLRFPLPPASLQPPNLPLLNPHRLSTISDMGFIPVGGDCSTSRSFSLLPEGESGHYALSGEHYVFDNSSDPDADPTWFTMQSILPFVHLHNRTGLHWAGPMTLRLSGQSPLFCVAHEMHVTVTYTMDIPGSEGKASGKQEFLVPIRFVHTIPPSTDSTTSRGRHSPTSSVSSSDMDTPLLANTPPPASNFVRSLPAYSQLFDSNGERRIDYSIPLPVYSPPSSSSSSTLDLDLETTALLGDDCEPKCD